EECYNDWTTNARTSVTLRRILPTCSRHPPTCGYNVGHELQAQALFISASDASGSPSKWWLRKISFPGFKTLGHSQKGRRRVVPLSAPQHFTVTSPTTACFPCDQSLQPPQNCARLNQEKDDSERPSVRRCDCRPAPRRCGCREQLDPPAGGRSSYRRH